MGVLDEVVHNFFTTPKTYLQEYFKEQTESWLVQFFSVVVSNPLVIKDQETKVKWAIGVICVIPPQTSSQLTELFFDKLGLSAAVKKNVLSVAEKIEINDLVKNFFSKDPKELQGLFKRKTYEWFVKFCDAVVEPSDQWAERVLSVIPPETCLHLVSLFFKKLQVGRREALEILEQLNPTIFQRANESMETLAPECHIDADLGSLEVAIIMQDKASIESYIQRIPHDHPGHFGHDLFFLVLRSGNMDAISYLLDTYLEKIGPEALQKYLEGRIDDIRYLFEKLDPKQLIDLHHVKGLSPLYFILKEKLNGI